MLLFKLLLHDGLLMPHGTFGGDTLRQLGHRFLCGARQPLNGTGPFEDGLGVIPDKVV